MKEHLKEGKTLSRRDALKILTATGGAFALSNLPGQWEKPLVQVGTLPAFAQTSPGQFPFTNDIEGVEVTEGANNGDVTMTALNGWIALSQAGSASPLSGASAYPYPWIYPKPWLHVKRKFKISVGPFPWSVKIKIKIKFKFKAKFGFTSSHAPKGGTNIGCFGVAGGNYGLSYVTKFQIFQSGGSQKAEMKFELPAFGSLWPFFFSCFFIDPFYLLHDPFTSYLPDYYLGPGFAGPRIKSSKFD